MLSITSLELGYDHRAIATLAKLEVKAGGHCLVTGASGSGKTTLLYAIAGLLTPMSGSITIAGKPISHLPESQRDRFRGEHIGIIFQTLHLVKSLTVEQNLMLTAYLSKKTVTKARITEVLEQLGIADKAGVLPEKLSQGQQQRVAIARAVLHSPKLILADEPTSSLDDAACNSVITVLKNMASAHNAGLVISTHDSRVKAHFSHVVQMEKAA